MAKLEFSDAGYDIGVNVKLTKRNARTGHIIEEREGHNRATKQVIFGITKYLNGEFNPTAPMGGPDGNSYRLEWDWIPRYLAIGTNIASGVTPPRN